MSKPANGQPGASLTVLVPIEPTEDMLDAADEAFHAELSKQRAANRRAKRVRDAFGSGPVSAAIYRAMIEAARGSAPPEGSVVAALREMRERALTLTKRHGNPVGTDYEQGVNDHGHRWVSQLDDLLAGLAARAALPQPGMSEANAPIPAVQSGAVAWRYGSRQHFGGWLYQDREPTDDQKADPYIRWEPLYLAAPQPEPLPGVREPFTVDDLAQEIRRVDGNHDLGAGALAEALSPFIIERIYQGLLAVASPPLPGEVGEREKVARIIDPMVYELTDALNNAEGEPEQLRKDATAHRDERLAKALTKADAILAALSGKEQG